MKPAAAEALYLAYCRDRSLSPNSLIGYRHCLGWLVRALPDIDLAQLAPADIDAAWRAVAAEPTLGPNTLRLYRVIMAGWLDWCVQKAGLPGHELRAIPLPREVAPHRPKVSIQRLYALRAACDTLGSDYPRLRALAILEALWSTLTRRAEVMALQVRHLRLEDDPPQVQIECGKGGWSGAIPISDRAAAALRAWLLVRGDPGHDWLWCNEGEQRLKMGQKALYRLLSRLARVAGLVVEECKPHAVRRGASTAMLQAGHDLGTVSLYLRHRSIQTTMDYVESSMTHLAEIRNWMEDAERVETQAASDAGQAAARAREEEGRQAAADAREQLHSAQRSAALDRAKAHGRLRRLPPA